MVPVRGQDDNGAAAVSKHFEDVACLLPVTRAMTFMALDAVHVQSALT